MAASTDYGDDEWDNEPADPTAIALMRAVSNWQIIFGGNYFDLPPSRCWLVWDKQNTGERADCELAWTNLKRAVRRLYWRWNGMIRKGHEERFQTTRLAHQRHSMERQSAFCNDFNAVDRSTSPLGGERCPAATGSKMADFPQGLFGILAASRRLAPERVKNRFED